MRRIGSCVGSFLWAVLQLNAQVGINTTNPQAQLDISSTNSVNPQVIDGILIPRIENFPATNPGTAQEGMLVYLLKARTDYPVGFYFWNSKLTAWTPITGKPPDTFFREGTSIPATGVEEGMYRLGNLGIGGDSPDVKLKVSLTSETPHNIRTGLEVDNSSSAPINVTYGILNNNRSLTDSRKYGIKNNVSAAGKGVHYGIWNEVYQNSVEEMYGIYNKVGRTYGATRNHYGIFTEIGTPEGSGFAFGIYSTAFGSNPDRVYAGYFAGRLGIGSSFEKQYVFPEVRGKENQMLRLDSAGNLEWKYAGQFRFASTGSTTGNFAIPDDIYTLRIDNGISSVSIPRASLFEGRILVLLAWNGIGPKTFTFSGSDRIWDSSLGSAVTTITSGERVMIQSTGTEWVVLSR